jgi:hypothetical protein
MRGFWQLLWFLLVLVPATVWGWVRDWFTGKR